MYIDVDTHYGAVRGFEKLSSRYPSGPRIEWEDGNPNLYIDDVLVKPYPKGNYDLDTKVAAMDREGFHRQVLIAEQREYLYRYDLALGCELAKIHNDCLAEDLANCPNRDRFIPTAYVYLPAVEESVKELERAVKELGFRGVKVTQGLGEFAKLSLATPELKPFYEKVAELDIPILVHGVGHVSLSPKSRVSNPALVAGDRWPIMEGGFTLLLGAQFTYSIEMVNLLFQGVLDEFPTLRICFLEGGVSQIPDLMDRFDRRVEWGAGRRPSLPGLKKPVEEYFKQIFVGAGAFEKYLPFAAQEWKDHNIVVASDYPHPDAYGTHPNTVKMIKENKLLSEEDKEKILGENAERLFGLYK